MTTIKTKKVLYDPPDGHPFALIGHRRGDVVELSAEQADYLIEQGTCTAYKATTKKTTGSSTSGMDGDG